MGYNQRINGLFLKLGTPLLRRAYRGGQCILALCLSLSAGKADAVTLAQRMKSDIYTAVAMRAGVLTSVKSPALIQSGV